MVCTCTGQDMVGKVYFLGYIEIPEVFFISLPIVAQHCVPTVTSGHAGCLLPKENLYGQIDSNM
jgi:hypothetical protein